MADTVLIKANQPSYRASDKPPRFQINTGGLRYFGVQVATDNFLLNAASASRRTLDRFFDSWLGDESSSLQASRARREVPPEKSQAIYGKMSYVLPSIVWNRLNWTEKLYYRAIASNDLTRRQIRASIGDYNWQKAPFITIARLPSTRRRSAIARFAGKNALRRQDLFLVAKRLMASTGSSLLKGRDRDFFFVFLDANYFDIVVLECHDKGLTDTIEAMPRKPDAVVNGQFISTAFGIGTEGQVIREGMIINTDSQSARLHIGQEWNGRDTSSYNIKKGDPSSVVNLRSAFGGLGPLLLGRAAVLPLTPWAKSIYNKDRSTGKGALAIHRDLGLILLIVQRDIRWLYPTRNTMKMEDLRIWLEAQGVSDAIFNDGSDSESLYAGGWMLEPGSLKDEAMDFAISFVDHTLNRRISVLAIDGTKTEDGKVFAQGMQRPQISHYAPENISDDLQSLALVASVRHTFRNEIIEAWRANSQNEADLVGNIFSNAGLGGYYADILYISSHSSRHGQLWMRQGDSAGNPKLMIANPWSSAFLTRWQNTPYWLIIAGCAVLSLRYTRAVKLTSSERMSLQQLHREIHGATATVPGLTTNKMHLLATYHPGWAWFQRIFQNSNLRGVLGYWYRSPAAGEDSIIPTSLLFDDVQIIKDFTERLSKGETFLESWIAANQRGIVGVQAAWAAIIRHECKRDTLANIEQKNLRIITESFDYFDRYQEEPIIKAYKNANRLDKMHTAGTTPIRIQSQYDRFAVDELDNLSPKPTPTNLLLYNDEVRPKE